MALPHRIWTDLISRTLVGYDDNNSFNVIGDFTNDHVEYCRVGNASVVGPMYYQWRALIKSLSTELAESLDEVVDYGIFMTVTLDNNTPGCTQWAQVGQTMRYPDLATAQTWDKDLVTGKHYDGVNPWGGYPQDGGYQGPEDSNLVPGGFPYSLERWIEAYQIAHRGNQYAPVFVRNGVDFIWANYVGCGATPWAPTEQLDGFIIPHKFVMNFLNPIVNSMSRKWIKLGTTPNIVLTGLGFDQADAELGDPNRYSGNNPLLNWNSIVDFIYLIGDQGQGTFTLGRIAGDFTVDDDTQITIVNLPNLPEGTYQIRLYKQNVGVAAAIGDVYSYAGDWRADDVGLCLPGPRMRLLITEDTPKEEDLLFLTEWQFKKGDLIISKYFAPIDIRSTDKFYDGRIINHSALTKSVDDESGLPNISDITIDLANADKEFSKLLAEYTIKNQLVSLFSAWKGEPETWKEYFMIMIVDDWDLNGPILRATLKDISQKYFRVTVPRYIITADEYPNAHENAITKAMPEILGKAYLDGELKGAVEAHCIDIVNFKYLAARGSIHSITQVYSENVLQTEGAGNDYTISYEDGGRTYINFNADQGDKRITFNCNGYMVADWNSANGYIQNPAYIIAFFLSLIAEVPIDFLDMTSFDDLADLLEDINWDEAGYLIIQDFQDMQTILSELLFTFGAKIFPDIYGRFKIERKDITNYEANLLLFDQIDTMEPVNYQQNLRELVNRIKAKWQYYPCQSLYVGALEDERLSSINTFDVEMESEPSPLLFQWTDLENVISSRIADELLKKGYGDKKAFFSISTNWLREIDILDNFRLQDLFAIDLGGEGAEGHYYYFERMSIDLVNGKIDITAPDLQWLVRQCMIIGQCSELEEYWEDASDAMRFYGYISECLTETFSDGELTKRVCKCGGG